MVGGGFLCVCGFCFCGTIFHGWFSILDLYLKMHLLSGLELFVRCVIVGFLNVNFRTFIWRQHFIQIPILSWAGVLDGSHLCMKLVCDFSWQFVVEQDLDSVILVSVFPVYEVGRILLLQLTFCCQIWLANAAA